MKKKSIISILCVVITAATHAETKIGTVDMNRIFKDYGKTQQAEARLNEAKDAAKKELDARAEAYKKALDEINKINGAIDAPALSAAAKAQKSKERDEKIVAVKSMEREITEFRQTREEQLRQQIVRMREGLLKEITEVVMARVKAKNFDLVLDRSGASMNGFSPILFTRDETDFTAEVVSALQKASRPEESESAASPAPKVGKP